jgi:hypothetical protein
MSGGNPPANVEERLARIEAALGEIERAGDPLARNAARELFANLIDLHGLALARVVAALAREPLGARALARLDRDDAVRPVLLLHGLHPDDLATRLGEAVAGLRSQGIEVSLTGLDHRRAILAVGGERQPGRHEAIESALYAAAPELDEVVIRAAAETAAPVAVAAG